MKFLVSVVISLLLFYVQAAEWKNVDVAHHLGGRKASVGYLQGKVVLVVQWDAKDAGSQELLQRFEELWGSFKTKELVVLGGPVGGGAAVKTALEKVSFPVYDGAGLALGEPPHEGLPFIYVVDETGKLVYYGQSDRTAAQAVVSALTDMESPRSVKQWRHFLDYELDHLPAHAYNRLNEFRKKHPDDAKPYLEKARALVKLEHVKKVADLVEFARRAKDAPNFGPKEKAKREKYEALVRGAIESCAPLKTVADPRLAQEAKNALADLKWAEAAF